MGNFFSSNDVFALDEIVNRGPPEPHEVQLSKQQIEQGLKAVADYLKAKQHDVSIVAVGGAVNTVLLKTRASTGDVDFFSHKKAGNEDVSKIIIAAEEARKLLKLGDQWLNNHTAVFIDDGTVKLLYEESVVQNEVVFRAQGLTVFAAPWRYALAAKLDRIPKPGARPYDINDAVDYLSKLIAKRGTAVKRSELEKWAKEFKFVSVPTKQLIDQLADEYKKKYHKDGIING